MNRQMDRRKDILKISCLHHLVAEAEKMTTESRINKITFEIQNIAVINIIIIISSTTVVLYK